MEKKIDIESSRLKQMRGKVLGVNNTTESIHIDANGPFILKLLDHFRGNWEHQKARGQPFDITHYLSYIPHHLPTFFSLLHRVATTHFKKHLSLQLFPIDMHERLLFILNGRLEQKLPPEKRMN